MQQIAVDDKERLTEELDRQSTVDHHHVADMLKVQQAEMVGEFAVEMEERVDKERTELTKSLAESLAKVQKLKLHARGL